MLMDILKNLSSIVTGDKECVALASPQTFLGVRHVARAGLTASFLA